MIQHDSFQEGGDCGLDQWPGFFKNIILSPYRFSVIDGSAFGPETLGIGRASTTRVPRPARYTKAEPVVETLDTVCGREDD